MAVDQPPGDGNTNEKARRKRDPERMQERILAAARQEFSDRGLDGARVDRIAELSGGNKRLLYHYFGNKEALYLEVLARAYEAIRAGEQELHLADLGPTDAMERLVRFTFRHFVANPWFMRLLNDENMHKGEYLKQLSTIPTMHSPLIAQIAELLERGADEGQFRRGVDPIQLYISIAGLTYFYLSNIHTLSTIFATDLASEPAMATREQHAVDVVLGYLRV